MKVKTLLFAALAAFALTFVSCSKEEEGTEQKVNSFTVSAADGLVNVVPATNETYVLTVCKSAEIEGLTDDEIVKKVLEKYADNISNYVVSGAAKNDCLLDMEIGVSYTALVFGYVNGSATTGLTKAEFIVGGGDTVVLEGLTAINQADFWGDRKGTINGKWVLAVTSPDYKKYLNLELASPVDQSANPVGAYDICDPYGEIGTAKPGYQLGTSFEGCTYIDMSSLPAKGTFLTSGRIAIKSAGNDKYVLRMFARDENKKSYLLDYEGGMYITDKTLGFQ